MLQILENARYLVLTGNYGSGKTEIAINLALEFVSKGKTTLIDLDIVNPYFRSGEKAEELEKSGVKVLMPTFAMTTVDIPALPAEIQSVFEVPPDKVVFDVGGDDTGAAALGRYQPSFAARKELTRTALVVNCMRPLTMRVEDIIDIAGRIEARGRLKIDILINNTNLAGKTEKSMVEEGERIVLACAEILHISDVLTTGEADILHKCSLITPVMPIRRYMVTEWMDQA